MVVDQEFLTKHERAVLLAALQDYARVQRRKAATLATAHGRAVCGANAHTAADLVRQLGDR